MGHPAVGRPQTKRNIVMSFTKEQRSQYRTLISMFHPDRVPDDFKDTANKICQILNKANDAVDWFTISDILRLVGKYGITKNSYDNINQLWEDWDNIPKTQQSRAKAEPKAKPKAEPLNQEILAKAKEKQQAEGWDRKKTASWLGFVYDLFGKDAKLYLDEIFKKQSSGKAKTGWTAQLYERLAQGPMSMEELEEWIKSTESKNVAAHKSHYWAICELANTIHAKK